MSDIVQRLRDSATQARAIDRSELLNEAADEIERLRSYEQSDEKSRFHDMARATLNSGKYGPEWHAAVANLDAVPAAIAVSDEDRTDKAATSHRRDRSGNTPVANDATTGGDDRPQPINDGDFDRSKPIADTPPPHTTPGECSKPREGT